MIIYLVYILPLCLVDYYMVISVDCNWKIIRQENPLIATCSCIRELSTIVYISCKTFKYISCDNKLKTAFVHFLNCPIISSFVKLTIAVIRNISKRKF